MNPEAIFQGQIVESMLQQGWHPIVIPDDSKKQHRFGQSFAAESKPYDLGALDRKGRYTAFELKATSGGTWPFTKLEESQVAGLKAVMERKRPAYILIWFNFRCGPRQEKEFGRKRVDEAWALPYHSYLKMIADAYKSLDLSEASDWAVEVPREGKELWNLKTFS